MKKQNSACKGIQVAHVADTLWSQSGVHVVDLAGLHADLSKGYADNILAARNHAMKKAKFSQPASSKAVYKLTQRFARECNAGHLDRYNAQRALETHHGKILNNRLTFGAALQGAFLPHKQHARDYRYNLGMVKEGYRKHSTMFGLPVFPRVRVKRNLPK